MLAESKALAARTDRTLTQVIEDVLRASPALQTKSTETEGWTHLPTVDGRGLRPGIDLDPTGNLLDGMERMGP